MKAEWLRGNQTNSVSVYKGQHLKNTSLIANNKAKTLEITKPVIAHLAMYVTLYNHTCYLFLTAKFFLTFCRRDAILQEKHCYHSW